MKTKLVILAIGIIFTACKKEKNDLKDPIPIPNINTIKITVVNDTVDFNNSSFCSEWSVGIGYDSLLSTPLTLPYYSIQSKDSNCVFTNNRKLEFNAGFNNYLILDTNLNGSVKKFSQGETIDYNAENVISSPGAASARILEEGVTNSFQLNSTCYLGTAFLKDGNYYNGWIKIKLLNNNYSCIILSYGVSLKENTPITAG